tara:strand:+ start:10086 stop:11252 length:1167 start_codon:yes stop_codon:yes gene_type:complete
MKIFWILLIIVFFNYNKTIAKEKVIFSIKTNSYTTIDLKKYLSYQFMINGYDLTQENLNKYSEQQLNSFIEAKIIVEFIKDRGIKISSDDIEKTYANLVRYINEKNNNNYNEIILKYNLTTQDIINHVTYEINKSVFNRIVLKGNEIEIPDTNDIKIDDYVRYKLNYLVLYKEDLGKEIYENQKNNIINIFKNNNFESASKIISGKKLNVKIYNDKEIDTKKINVEVINKLKKIDLNNNFTFENEKAFYIFQKIKTIYPEIDIKYSFIQLISNNKNILLEIKKSKNVCTDNEDLEAKYTNSIKLKYFNDVNVKDLNISIFNRLYNINESLLISGDKNLHNLITICAMNYNKNKFEELYINEKHQNVLDIERNKLIKKLKIKYNYINYT